MKQLLGIICAGLILSVLTCGRWLPETDLLDILPSVESDQGFKAAQELHLERLSRKLVFLVVGEDWEALSKDAKSLQGHLKSWKGLNLLEEDFSKYDSLSQQLTQSKAQLLDAEWLRLIQEKKTARIISDAKARIYSPFSGFSGSSLMTDPLGIIQKYFSQKLSSSSLKTRDGFVSVETPKGYAVLFLAELVPERNDFRGHSLFVNHLKKWSGTSSEVIYTGYPLYSYAGAEQGKAEFSSIGVASLFGVVLLLIAAFRSFLPVLASFGLIFLSYWLAYTSTVLVMGKIHIFTLVIGASLIGVSVDYALHYFAKTMRASKSSRDEISTLIRRPILISFGSTIVGFLSLFFMPFEVLKQSALFFVVGLSVSAVLVLYAYPMLNVSTGSIPRIFYLLRKKRLPIPGGAMIAMAFLSTALLFTVVFNDDVRALQAANPELKEYESRI